MVTPDSLSLALERLRAAAGRVRELEAEARRLAEAGDVPGHRRLMIEKATLLTKLPETLADVLASLPPAQAGLLADGAKDFARRAGQALSVGSPFYMSALLYPDDYAEGDPNDLELFIAEFAGD